MESKELLDCSLVKALLPYTVLWTFSFICYIIFCSAALYFRVNMHWKFSFWYKFVIQNLTCLLFFPFLLCCSNFGVQVREIIICFVFNFMKVFPFHVNTTILFCYHLWLVTMEWPPNVTVYVFTVILPFHFSIGLTKFPVKRDCPSSQTFRSIPINTWLT